MQRLLTQQELADELGLHRKTIQGWVARGLTGYQRSEGKRTYYTVGDAKAWARRQHWLRADVGN